MPDSPTIFVESLSGRSSTVRFQLPAFWLSSWCPSGWVWRRKSSSWVLWMMEAFGRPQDPNFMAGAGGKRRPAARLLKEDEISVKLDESFSHRRQLGVSQLQLRNARFLTEKAPSVSPKKKKAVSRRQIMEAKIKLKVLDRLSSVSPTDLAIHCAFEKG
ncbi:hypothetical protein CDAR_91991 [Caerostris darwini]|uniref:Uncharacterized protein n=1 Tax=Caerostris darwini TaxID=1538125 RepID=A0AAV4QQI4_9ARAC|nr:hypothetical protein CDAR_91991 [Caerostris darwini]